MKCRVVFEVEFGTRVGIGGQSDGETTLGRVLRRAIGQKEVALIRKRRSEAGFAKACTLYAAHDVAYDVDALCTTKPLMGFGYGVYLGVVGAVDGRQVGSGFCRLRFYLYTLAGGQRTEVE